MSTSTDTRADLRARQSSMDGKTVQATGGSGGIGRATALGLSRMGADLAIVGRDRERTEEAAHEIRAAGGGRVDVFVADLSSQAEVRRLAAEVLRDLPRISDEAAAARLWQVSADLVGLSPAA